MRICRDVASAAAGASTLIGAGKKSTPDLAAFANGAALRYYDLNDNLCLANGRHGPSQRSYRGLPGGGRVRTCERPAASDGDPARLEINCRLVDAFDAPARGWDTPVYSLPAVALAAGKLMKLPPAKLTQAVNLALNDHIPMGQTRTQTNSDWKGFADAEAARNAIFAATLARGGMTGPAPVFEGRKGFFQLVVAPAEVDVAAFGRRGRPSRSINAA